MTPHPATPPPAPAQFPPYVPNTDADRTAMLAAIGVERFDDLIQDIPSDKRFPRLKLRPAAAALDPGREIAEMAAQNQHAGAYGCFLGAGAYRHFIPAVVKQTVA